MRLRVISAVHHLTSYWLSDCPGIFRNASSNWFPWQTPLPRTLSHHRKELIDIVGFFQSSLPDPWPNRSTQMTGLFEQLSNSNPAADCYHTDAITVCFSVGRIYQVILFYSDLYSL